jgi:ComF family protein
MLNALSRRAAAWLPSQCAVCHLWQQDVVCRECLDRDARPKRRCHTCALALSDVLADARQHQCGACIAASALGQVPLSSCRAAVSYVFPWDEKVVAFKFGNEPAWAGFFAALMLRQAGVQELLGSSRWWLPMPLSDGRLRTRGYNQATLLAQALSVMVSADVPRCSARVNERILLRVRDTVPQPGLDRAAREANLHGAMVVDPLCVAQVEGQRVVLVDDVMTSGASLHAAARALSAAGAETIHALVFARTEAEGSGSPITAPACSTSFSSNLKYQPTRAT